MGVKPHIPTLKSKYLGKEVISRKGEKGVIIRVYRDQKATVRFEDGVEHDYNIVHLNSGAFSHPNTKREGLVSKRTIANLKEFKEGNKFKTTEGREVTVIKYNSSSDIEVAFQDGKTRHVSASKLRSGTIQYQSRTELNIQKLVGKLVENKIGVKAQIVGYENQENVILRFEDGTEGKYRLDCVKLGVFENKNNPNSKVLLERRAKELKGKKFKLKDGTIVTVKEYRNSNDVDIILPDGTIKNTSVQRLKDGAVPKTTIHRVSELLGTEVKNNIGVVGTISEVINSVKVRVDFKDGSIPLENKSKQGVNEIASKVYLLKHLRSGVFQHPKLSNIEIRRIKLTEELNKHTLKDENGKQFKVQQYINSTNIQIRYMNGELRNTTLNTLRAHNKEIIDTIQNMDIRGRQ